MDNLSFFTYLLVLSGSTYLIRAVPFALLTKKIKNTFIQSFLYYIPYTVLTAMTIPAALYATRSLWSAVAGLVVAVIFALWNRSLTVVAVAGCVTVYVVELLII